MPPAVRSSFDKDYTFTQPSPVAQPVESPIAHICKPATETRCTHRPSSDSLLSMPFSKKLVWEMSMLRDKINTLNNEGDESEREVYEALLRGKEALLKLEQARSRLYIILYRNGTFQKIHFIP